MITNKIWGLILLCSMSFCNQVAASNKPIQVKVFVAAMFEIGANSGDKAGEFQHWYQRYFNGSQPIDVKAMKTSVVINLTPYWSNGV